MPGVHAHFPTQEELDEAVRAIEARGVRAIGADHDLRSNESCAALYRAAVDAFGKVDILCNARRCPLGAPDLRPRRRDLAPGHRHQPERLLSHD